MIHGRYGVCSYTITLYDQVEFVNGIIASSGPPLRNATPLVDPSPQFQVVLTKWMDFFMLNRKQHLCESDISTLHEKAKDLLRVLNEVLPDRTGSMHGDGTKVGWNIWKAHVVLHQAMERMLYGYSETTSAQGAESAHKVNI